MKFLLWIAIGFAVIWVLRNKKSQVKSGAAKPRETVRGKPDATEPMVRCAQCGIYLPESEALHNASGDVFCCEEHRNNKSPA